MRSETLRFKTSDLANVLMVDARYHSRLPVAIPGFCNFERVPSRDAGGRVRAVPSGTVEGLVGLGLIWDLAILPRRYQWQRDGNPPNHGGVFLELTCILVGRIGAAYYAVAQIAVVFGGGIGQMLYHIPLP